MLTGRIIWKSDTPEYNLARLDYNLRFNRYPRVIVYAQKVQDVSNAILWARENDVPLRARSGRHSYEAYSLVENGIIIDVSDLASIEVDRKAKTATIGAGAALWPIYQTLWDAGVAIPGGSCPTVGIAGLTLGGGFGLLSRLHGLTSDTLLAVQLVDANGRVVNASKDENPELFWACQGGGGGNFGIVTSFTFRVVPVGDVAIYNIAWPWSELEAVVEEWQQWAPTVDRRLTCVLKLNGKVNGSIATLGQFVGPQAELTDLLRNQLRIGAPTVSIQTESFLSAVEFFGGLKPVYLQHWRLHWQSDEMYFKNTSAYAYEPFDAKAIKTLIANLSKAPNSQALVQCDNYGGAVADVKPSATAFWHRKALWNMQYQTYWDDPADAAANIAWVEKFRVSMLPFTNGAYVNYLDGDIEDYEAQYYGGNASRLAKVKRKWDPEDVFKFPQSVRGGHVPLR